MKSQISDREPSQQETTDWRSDSAWRAFLNNKMGLIGLIMLASILLMALFAPLIAPYDPYQQSTAYLLPPSWQHWLGMNHVGQDIWSQLVYGARTSLLVGFGVGILSTLLSTVFGVTAA